MNCVVSIICNTYNHEPYIRKCLDGFLMQKTDFYYEVLIHDDASTDNTARIIKEYEEKYPTIIKPIYEAENQWKKHDGSIAKIQYGRAVGEFIAFCEGDDYWIDELKLQKQVDAMRQMPEVDMCAHSALVYVRGKHVNNIAPYDCQQVLSTEEVIFGGGSFLATNSLMFRKKLFEDEPLFRKKYRIDYSLQIYGSLRGGILFLPDSMSVYNYMTVGSWSSRTYGNYESAYKNYIFVTNLLGALNNDTNGKYKDCIEKTLRKEEFAFWADFGPFNRANKKKYLSQIKSLPKKQRVLLRIKMNFPFLIKIVRTIKYGC